MQVYLVIQRKSIPGHVVPHAAVKGIGACEIKQRERLLASWIDL